MNRIEIIVGKKTNLFLKQIKRLSNISHGHPFSNRPIGFPIFYKDEKFYEKAFFDERIENLTWRILVNGVIRELFSADYCMSPCINVEWPEINLQLASSYVETIERYYPFEFIVESDDKRTGYRYSNCYWSEEQIKRVFHDCRLDSLEIIVFSEEISSVTYPLIVPKQFREQVEFITLKDFFLRFFSEQDYKSYLEMIQETMMQAYQYVGLQTIPNMTLQYLSHFTKKTLDDICTTSLSKKEYIVVNFDKLKPSLRENINSTTNCISEEDYRTMDEAFYKQGRYYAMCGSALFAKSFLTSEYLFQTMQTNNHFDYTAIVTGYLKSIEQLLYMMVMFTLRNGTDRELWIKYKWVDSENNPETRLINHTKHVRFIRENEVFFDTSFGPLVNLLNANRNGWLVSRQARNRIITCLLVFCAECRNEHFHKDNIDVEHFREVEIIRHNTVLLLYYLLGGYAFSGDVSADQKELGIKDRRFDEMYQAIMRQSIGGDYFILNLKDCKSWLVALPFNHGEIEYNEDGLIKNPQIRFVRINRSIEDDWHQDDWQSFEEGPSSESDILITPDNMPLSIQYIEKTSGKRKTIIW